MSRHHLTQRGAHWRRRHLERRGVGIPATLVDAALPVDAVRTVLGSSPLSSRHRQPPTGVSCLRRPGHCPGDGQYFGRCSQLRKEQGALGFGGVSPARWGDENHGAVRQLFLTPTVRTAEEGFDQVVPATLLNTLARGRGYVASASRRRFGAKTTRPLSDGPSPRASSICFFRPSRSRFGGAGCSVSKPSASLHQ